MFRGFEEGGSGGTTHKMKVTCKNEGMACSKDGILQDQFDGTCCVPKVMPAARMAPTNQHALNMEVRTGRSLG